MANPTPYVPSYSFSGWQTSNPSKPLPANQVDNEYANISLSISQTIAALADVRRSDGKLKNGIVTVDSFSPGLTLGFTLRGAWTLGAHYVVGDGVFYAGKCYRCQVVNDATNLNRPDVDTTTWVFLYNTTDLAGAMSIATYDPTGVGANVFARANHTGTQAISTVSGLQTALDAKASKLVSYAVKSAGYTAVAADVGGTLRFTAAATLALTAAATLGNGYSLNVVADGGAVTIDPNGSETIDGRATLVIPNGSAATIICDGSNFFTAAKPQSRQPIGGLIDLAGLSAFAWQNLGACRDLSLRIAGIPSGTTGIPFLRVSSNNGSSYDSGASDYTNAHSVTEGATVAGVPSVSSTSFPLGNVAFDSQPFEFTIAISEWNKAAVTSFDSTGYFGNTATSARRKQGAYGTRAASTAFDALQLSISAGTFTRGYAILEGIVG